METGQRVKWSGEYCTYWPKMKMVTYLKKLLGDALMGACSSTVPRRELLLKKLNDDGMLTGFLRFRQFNVLSNLCLVS